MIVWSIFKYFYPYRPMFWNSNVGRFWLNNTMLLLLYYNLSWIHRSIMHKIIHFNSHKCLLSLYHSVSIRCIRTKSIHAWKCQYVRPVYGWHSVHCSLELTLKLPVAGNNRPGWTIHDNYSIMYEYMNLYCPTCWHAEYGPMYRIHNYI